MPLANSVRGAFLRFSDPAYLRTIHAGVKLIEWAIVLRAIAFFGNLLLSATSVVASAYQNDLRSWLLYTPAYLAAYIGWWMFTASDPGLQTFDPSRRPRRWIRITILAAIGVTFVDLVVLVAGLPFARTVTNVVGVLSFVGWVIRTMVAIQYCLWLARRAESAKVAGTAQTMTWGIPVLATVGSIVLGLGALLAIAFFLGLLDDVRSLLRRARRQRETITTPPAGLTAGAHPIPPAP